MPDPAAPPASYHRAPPADCSLSVPGISHLVMSAMANDREWIATGTGGQVHDGDLEFGKTEAAGPVKLHYPTAAAYRALARAADRIADWMEMTG